MTTTWIDATPAYAGFPDKLLLPAWAQVVKITPEAEGVATFAFQFTDPQVQERYRWQPGQFNMLYIPGYGEAAFSMSSDVETSNGLVLHTIRNAGSVSKAASRLKVGDMVGLRGPFGTSWPLQAIQSMDVIIASGGIGLPPLRGAIYSILRERQKYGKVTLLYGARSPRTCCTRASTKPGRKLVSKFSPPLTVAMNPGTAVWVLFRCSSIIIRVDPHNTFVLTCGPEIMMRFVIYEALARRIPSEHIFVSLERNMKCGQGACGHCQLGPYFICKDGPVFPFSRLEAFFNVEEY